MKLSFIFLLLYLNFNLNSYAHFLPPAIKRIMQQNNSVIIYQLSNKTIFNIKDLPKNFKYSGQQLIKNNNGLFLFPFGTGRIYQLNQENYKWQRIDSTFFTGYNFGCIYFNLGNEFYSFGGDGFWQNSGHLRTYNKFSKEWNAVKLNNSIPWKRISFDYSYFYFIDSVNKFLYIQNQNIEHDQALKYYNVKKNTCDIYSLDILKGEWHSLGINKDSLYRIYATLPWGLYVDLYYVIDIKNNRILKFSEKLYDKINGIIFKSTGNHELDLSYCIDSTIYFGNYTSKLDSITISRLDLIDTGKYFYTENKENTLSEFFNRYIFLFIITFLILFFILYKLIKQFSFFYKIKGKSKNKKTIIKTEDSSYNSNYLHEILNEQELKLVKLIYNNSISHRLTNLNEINICLGVTKRSNEAQKRIRSIFINSINQKLCLIKGEKEPIIDRIRNEIDKRNFEYYIKEKNLEFVSDTINININPI